MVYFFFSRSFLCCILLPGIYDTTIIFSRSLKGEETVVIIIEILRRLLLTVSFLRSIPFSFHIFQVACLISC